MSAPRYAPLLVAAVVLAATLTAPPPTAAQESDSCSRDYYVDHAGWTFCWLLDGVRGQGLEVMHVQFQGHTLFWRIGFPFSITHYPDGLWDSPLKDVLGYAGGDGNPGYGDGPLQIDPAACPRWLGSGQLFDNRHVCLETLDGPVPAVAVWSRFNIQNYRYVQGYLFHADGRLEPKLLLGGELVDVAECPDGGSGCLTHHHYMYWRFDTDVEGYADDRFQAFGAPTARYTNQNDRDPPACDAGTPDGWCTVVQEGARAADPAAYPKWRVVDLARSNGNGAPPSIELTSGSAGGVTAVSTADAWVLRYVDDNEEIGYEVSYSPTSDAAIHAYADPAADTDGQDLVIWYAERVLHEPRDEDAPSMPHHETGPTLRVRNVVDANPTESTYP